MAMNDFNTDLDFGRAAVAHFKLPGDQVHRGMTVNTKVDDVFSLTLTISLTADDLAGIAAHMKEAATIAGEKELDTFLGKPVVPVIPQPQLGRRS